MKKTLLKSLALAVVGSFCVVGAASASMMEGGIGMVGAFTPINVSSAAVSIADATGINFGFVGTVNNAFGVTSATGSFVQLYTEGTEMQIGSITDFQFASGPDSFSSIPDFWSIEGFSFEMTSVATTKFPVTDPATGALTGSTGIAISGLGMMSGYDFDDTPGIWSFTAQGAGETNFSWSASTDAAPVPEPATMVLFGTGLIGLASISARRRKKQIQAM